MLNSTETTLDNLILLSNLEDRVFTAKVDALNLMQTLGCGAGATFTDKNSCKDDLL
jgi:hypothetical protein